MEGYLCGCHAGRKAPGGLRRVRRLHGTLPPESGCACDHAGDGRAPKEIAAGELRDWKAVYKYIASAADAACHSECILPAVLAGRHMAVSLEDPDKGFRILISKPCADIRYAHLSQQQEIFPLLEPYRG